MNEQVGATATQSLVEGLPDHLLDLRAPLQVWEYISFLQRQHGAVAVRLAELTAAARRASVKMHIEYQRHQPDADPEECWAEVEALDAFLRDSAAAEATP